MMVLEKELIMLLLRIFILAVEQKHIGEGEEVINPINPLFVNFMLEMLKPGKCLYNLKREKYKTYNIWEELPEEGGDYINLQLCVPIAGEKLSMSEGLLEVTTDHWKVSTYQDVKCRFDGSVELLPNVMFFLKSSSQLVDIGEGASTDLLKRVRFDLGAILLGLNEGIKKHVVSVSEELLKNYMKNDLEYISDSDVDESELNYSQNRKRNRDDESSSPYEPSVKKNKNTSGMPSAKRKGRVVGQRKK